jgi:hypothetical protein
MSAVAEISSLESPGLSSGMKEQKPVRMQRKKEAWWAGDKIRVKAAKIVG